MMSAQMLSAASNVSGTVADLAPGAKDGMRMLEAKAAQMAHEDRTRNDIYKKFQTFSTSFGQLYSLQFLLLLTAQQPKGGNILFVRGETQGQDRDGTDTTRVVNPDEINIDEDDDDDDDGKDSDGGDDDGML